MAGSNIFQGLLAFPLKRREEGSKGCHLQGSNSSAWIRASLAAISFAAELSCQSAGKKAAPSSHRGGTKQRCEDRLDPSHATGWELSLLGRYLLENETSAGWLKGFVLLQQE